MKNMARILSIFLVVCTITLLLFSCRKGRNDKEDETTEKREQSTQELDEYGRVLLKCDVVESGADYGYEPIRILTTEDRKYETYDEEGIPGDMMNEALYARNMYVESAINVELNFVYSAYTSKNKTMMQKIRNSVMGLEETYHLVLPHAYYSTPLVAESCCTNLLTTSNLDFSRPWWNASMNEEMSMNNQLYIGVGDFSLSSVRNTFCMFYNKSILSDFAKDIDIYEVVEDHEWTVEFFKTLIKDIYSDKDEVQGKSEGDTYGFAVSDHAFNADAFLSGFRVSVTNRMADGKVGIGFGDALSIEAFGVTQDLYFLDETYQYGHNEYEKVRSKFAAGQAGFVADMFCMTDTIGKEMNDYGIVPVPLMNENQDDYASTSQEGFSALIIPSSVKDAELERTTAALETLCYASYNKIVPLYYEKILKKRYSPLEEDSRMYDLILNSRYYNFGFVYSHSIENILWSWRTNLPNQDINISSYWNVENGALYDSALNKLLDFFYPAA